MRAAVRGLLGAALFGCGVNEPTAPPPPPAPRPRPTAITLQSDPGDYVGGGRNYAYSLANSIITLNTSATHLSFTVGGDQQWWGEFQLPNTTSQLAVGTYANAQRYPFNDAAHPGIDWTGEGRGCNTQAGSFAIDSLTVGSVVEEIDLTFEQHCDGATPALRGTIHWYAGDRTKPPGPVTPIPSNLWSPAPGSTPSAGNYLYLNSDPGDYIGEAQLLTYTSFTVEESNGLLTVHAPGGPLGDWLGSFQVMNSINVLQVGYYGDLRRYPFHNPAKGGLDWSGQGRGCNTLTGWFAVDHVTHANNALTAMDLRFEQHCEGGTAALHGAIHWAL